MDTRIDEALSELVVALDVRDDQDTLTVVDEWRKKRKQAREEQANRLRQMALDSIYQIARVDSVPVWDDLSDEVRHAIKPVERFAVRYRDLPAFAQDRGLKLDELMEVLDFKRLEVKARGMIYRSGSTTRRYEAPRREASEIQALANREATEHRESIAKREEAKRAVPKYIEPTITEWKSK